MLMKLGERWHPVLAAIFYLLEIVALFTIRFSPLLIGLFIIVAAVVTIGLIWRKEAADGRPPRERWLPAAVAAAAVAGVLVAAVLVGPQVHLLASTPAAVDSPVRVEDSSLGGGPVRYPSDEPPF